MNRIELIGRATKDVALNTSTSGTKYTKFNLAVRRRYPDKDGYEIVDFHSCTAFNKLAETISKYVKKGDKVFIAGELIYNEYTNSKGETHKNSDITVNEIEFFGSKKVESAETPEAEELTPVDDVNLPF